MPLPIRGVRTGERDVVLVVSSQPLVAAGLAELVERGLGAAPVVSTVVPGPAALSLRGGGSPRAIIVAPGPGENALDLVTRAHQTHEVPVLCALACEDRDEIRRTLAAGADGYLIIELTGPEDLRDTLEAVEAGTRVVPVELSRIASRRTSHLTPRGAEVLGHLAQGLHDEEIADAMGISINSVRKHVQATNERMGARSRTGAVAAAVRAGLIGVLVMGALAGCGSGASSDTAAQTRSTSAANTPPPTDAPSSVSKKPLPAGDEGQITKTIQAFYAAASSGDTKTACAQMSKEGQDGFLKGAEQSYPGMVHADSSSCEDAMTLFSQGIQANRDGLAKDGVPEESSDLSRVNVTEIKVDGDTAQAIAPDQVIGIDPKYISLERDGDGWLITGSTGLDKKGQ
ncbi:MAG: two-component system, NarL family, nitrate/nitrite response regulator NarL [Thermoleophilaceae bacterium]|nr:two-component system, NarL family, nitrate/nitrite response regulator NarL [Thermoleophilaceae bacterium]